jgi:4-amino-4-deoxy-L-arabinose transferase-like glycosyltransferase
LFCPLLPFVVAILSWLLPIPSGFFLVNSFLWIGTTYLFYLFAQDLLKSDDLALACSLIFTTSLPVLVWGLPIMVDMGAYFFVALILFADQKLKSLRGAAVIGIVTGLAILTKPTLASVLLFLIIYHVSRGKKIRAFIIAVVGLVLVGSVYSYLGLKFKDLLSYSSPRHRGVFYVLNSLFFCFHGGLMLVFWSWKGLKENSRFYVLFILAVLSFYLPFVHNPRLLFIIYPAVIPLMCVGADTLSLGLFEKFHWDKKASFHLIVFMLVVVSNLLSGFYLYMTRTVALRSIEDLLRVFP